MSLEQTIVCVSKCADSLKPIMPYARAPDALTLAHRGAAEYVHSVASWLLRGHDLATITTRTPFWVQDAAGLWGYYDSLRLDRRPEKIFLVLMVSEFVSREDYPKLRRVLDIYAGTVALACCFPQRFFYWLHRARWNYLFQEATYQVGPPQPLPTLPDSIDGAMEAAKDTFGLAMNAWQTGVAKQKRTSSSNSWSWSVWLLAATSVGVAVVWASNPGSATQAKQLVVQKYQELRDQAKELHMPSLKVWLTGGDRRGHATGRGGEMLQLQLPAIQ
mmetsp:Transcript_2220/g.4678  ORF Transcript_2220/g.4678 Transcript_2220/m.4678 type:complete len:274 (-) Transcript_2220:126-947(-)